MDAYDPRGTLREIDKKKVDPWSNRRETCGGTIIITVTAYLLAFVGAWSVV